MAALLQRVETFTEPEVACAVELLELSLGKGAADYTVRVALESGIDGKLLGYICFGPTPMTEGTFDLYWIATAPEARGKGVGSALIGAMEHELRQRGGRIVRVETSAQEAYGPTRGFYQAMRYEEEARFRDFYKPGDDLVILAKRL